MVSAPGSPPVLTSLPPGNEADLSYRYFGRRAWPGDFPLFVHDATRVLPMWVAGGAGTGKTEFLVQHAYQEACRGRFTLFVDGSDDPRVRRKLAFWCQAVAGRPFYCWRPESGEGGAGSAGTDPGSGAPSGPGHTWNPCFCPGLPAGLLGEQWFNAYVRFGSRGHGADVDLGGERDRLLRAVRILTADPGKRFHAGDLRCLLEEAGGRRLARQAFAAHHPAAELLESWPEAAPTRPEENDRTEGGGDGVPSRPRAAAGSVDGRLGPAAGVGGFLRWFERWPLCCYQPAIDLARLRRTAAVVYVGLPATRGLRWAGALGNLLIHQFLAYAQHQRDPQDPHWSPAAAACLVDDADAFLEPALASLLMGGAGVPSTVVASTRGLAAWGEHLEGGAADPDEWRHDAHVVAFRPDGAAEGEWIGRLVGEKNAGPEEIRALTTELAGLGVGQAFCHSPAADGLHRLATPVLPEPPAAFGWWALRPRRYVQPLTGAGWFLRERLALLSRSAGRPAGGGAGAGEAGG